MTPPAQGSRITFLTFVPQISLGTPVRVMISRTALRCPFPCHVWILFVPRVSDACSKDSTVFARRTWFFATYKRALDQCLLEDTWYSVGTCKRMPAAHGFKEVDTTDMNHLMSTSSSTVFTCKPRVRGVGQRHRFEHRRCRRFCSTSCGFGPREAEGD